MGRGWIYPVKQLILSDKVGRWCRLPYPDHPKGCPNFGKAEKCPPEALAAGDYFDLSRPTWLVHSEFNLSSHIARMKKKHPEWTLKQCRCVLYWQPASRRQLKYRIEEALSIVNADGSTLIPEAMGVNVYATARLSGLHLEKIRHLEMCRHVALIGSIKDNRRMPIPF